MAAQKITGRLLAAGRALAGISHVDLAIASGIPLDSILLLEANGSAWLPDTHADALLNALETFGILIISEGDGMGAGVRLKFTRQDTKQIGRLENEGGIVGPDDAP